MEAATSRFLARRALAPAASVHGVGDRTLVERARAGDSDAYESVYARYHAEILWFCRRKLRSREDAEDAAQNTFAAAYRELLQSESDVELRPWLYGIARHRCLMLLRSRRAEVDSIDDEHPAGEDTADAVVRRQDLRELFVDLGELPHRQRAALLLSEVGGLSHAQIASTLQCRPSQVKALVFQARTSLTDTRLARGVACAEIRRELASARGAALLRRHLRRHVSACPGCKQFEAAVKRDRSAVALGLSLFPAAGSGTLAALGPAARLRLAQLLTNLPFGAPLSSGGWRWVAALTGAAAAAGGGVAAIGVGGSARAARPPQVAAAARPPWPGGADALPRFASAPGWTASPAWGRRGGAPGAAATRAGRAAGAARHRYARAGSRRTSGAASQTLGALLSRSLAGQPPAGAAGTSARGSTLSPRVGSPPSSGSSARPAQPDHGAPGHSGADHPARSGGSHGGGGTGSSASGRSGAAPAHGNPGHGGGEPPHGQPGSGSGPGASGGGGGGGGSPGAGHGDGHGPPPGHGQH